MPERQDEERETKNIFEEILVETLNTLIQEIEEIPSKPYQKKTHKNYEANYTKEHHNQVAQKK